MEGTTNLSDLPDEVLVSIFALQPLSVTDIANLSLVCKRFNSVANDNQVWRAKCSRLRRYCFIRLKLGLKEKEGLKEEEEKEASKKSISWKEVFKHAVKRDTTTEEENNVGGVKGTGNYKELWDSTAEQRKNYFEKTYGTIPAEEEEAIQMGDTFVTPSVASVIETLQRGGAYWGNEWPPRNEVNVVVDDLHEDDGEGDDDYELQLALALSMQEDQQK